MSEKFADWEVERPVAFLKHATVATSQYDEQYRSMASEILAYRDVTASMQSEHDAEIVQLVREVSAMREQRDRLRAALVGMVGVDTREELEQIEAAIRLTPAPAQDKANAVDAVHALLATL